jgi:hypothetical protein
VRVCDVGVIALSHVQLADSSQSLESMIARVGAYADACVATPPPADIPATPPGLSAQLSALGVRARAEIALWRSRRAALQVRDHSVEGVDV